MLTAQELIDKLGLQPLPEEGGFFVETYRATQKSAHQALSPVYRGPRNVGTAIYYLLTPGTFSAMHLLPGDEIFHFYLGDPIEMLQLKPDGTGEIIIIGTDLKCGMRPQVCVPGGVWQGSRLISGGKLALLGTTMTPGFDFEDYTPGNRKYLADKFPLHLTLIAALTRE